MQIWTQDNNPAECKQQTNLQSSSKDNTIHAKQSKVSITTFDKANYIQLSNLIKIYILIQNRQIFKNAKKRIVRSLETSVFFTVCHKKKKFCRQKVLPSTKSFHRQTKTGQGTTKSSNFQKSITFKQKTPNNGLTKGPH